MAKLKQRDGYTAENEEQATEVPGGELQGFSRSGTSGERGEKDADFDIGDMGPDGGGGDGWGDFYDGTKLMPYLRQIHKIGHLVKRANFSTLDLEDMDATNQSFFNPPVAQRTGTSDVRDQGGVATGDIGDIPVADADNPGSEESSKRATLVKTGYLLENCTQFQGIPIAVEHGVGSVRKGVSREGHRWKTIMQHPYGYIEGTKGADGEEVDVYVGPEETAGKAYVIHQKEPDTGKFDEDKVMLGFNSKREAKEAFLAHYDTPDYLGPISEVPMDRFKELVSSKRKLTKIAYSAFVDEFSKLAEEAKLPETPTISTQPDNVSSVMPEHKEQPIDAFTETVDALKQARRQAKLLKKLWIGRPIA